jgi:hypothetical protein
MQKNLAENTRVLIGRSPGKKAHGYHDLLRCAINDGKWSALRRLQPAAKMTAMVISHRQPITLVPFFGFAFREASPEFSWKQYQ